MTHLGHLITLTSGDAAQIESYEVKASGASKHGLVVIMEAFGVNDHIKEVCDRFAAQGYNVLSPQLYDRQVKNFGVGYTQEDIQKTIDLRAKTSYETTVMDAQMCIDKLHADGNAKVFITGFCYGGSVTWLAACRCKGLSAASCYYGGAIKDFNTENPKCPTICHFGEKDKSIPLDTVRTIAKAHPNVKVYTYDAGHGFNSDRRDFYDKPSADLAMQRTLEFFASV